MLSFGTLAAGASPEALADTAQSLGCRSVAFTYNDPTIFLEYAIDAADACHRRGIKAIAVTAATLSPPRGGTCTRTWTLPTST